MGFLYMLFLEVVTCEDGPRGNGPRGNGPRGNGPQGNESTRNRTIPDEIRHRT
jgi:hypothetical protein